uniref:Uncharacterized protein n=1 Tax=Clastoptera arizonana TaxID=38151 RepID=A0A1B6CFN2_9HEMI
MEDEPDIREQIFHNTVREYIIFLLFFLLLYLFSFAIVNSFRRQDKDDYYSPDEDEAKVYRISLWLCTFSLSVSVCAALLLPFSIISNEVLLLYPTSYYVKWLNHSLIQGLWNHVFLFSNLSLFILLPFAYLFTESAGLSNNPKTLMSRVYETSVVLILLIAVVLGITYVITALVDSENSNISLVLISDIWSYHLPFLYSCISFLGVLLLLLCTPLGFARLFGVVGHLLVKPQFLQDVNEEFFVAQMEEECVRRRLEQAAHSGKSYITPKPMYKPQMHDDDENYLGLENGELQAGLSSRLTEINHQRILLERQRKTSSLHRNILYPVAILLLLGLTVLTVLIVLLNTMELLIGIKALPLSTREFTLGLSSLYKLGTVGAILEIVLILYLAVTSSIGLYSLPLIGRVSPRRSLTPLSHLIANSALLLFLSSALPLLVRILGITNFDLLGRFGQIEWLGNFRIVLLYNLVFVGSATLCLVNKFTATVRRELFNRLQLVLAVLMKITKKHPARIMVTPIHAAKQD